MRVKELAEWLGAAFEGDGEAEIRRVAALEDAAADELSFVTGGRAARTAVSTQAGCLLVPPDYVNDPLRTVIRVKNPRTTVARIIPKLHPEEPRRTGIHPTAVVDASAVVHPAAFVGPHVTVGARTRIGADTSIGAGSVIGTDVRIGDACRIYPQVTIYREVRMGSRVTLHSGCVIGADGFGFVFTEGRYEKFPQVGRVEIADDVEIGANSCVDRAALGVTTIGQGTKLDNMVHIGHNCRIGKHVVVAAQTGFSGGVVVEDYAVIGGQVGVGDKARIETRAVIGSGSGILTSKIVRTGSVVWGTPARPLKQYLAQLATLSRLAKKQQ